MAYPVLALGLSPRVRGNQVDVLLPLFLLGSIPACTGKPLRRSVVSKRNQVYPRVYGETQPSEVFYELSPGLSPRVRGNPRTFYHVPLQDGSIPACTGKPLGDAPDDVADRVYPRVYGETRVATVPWESHIGLSPRVRGNPRRCAYA